MSTRGAGLVFAVGSLCVALFCRDASSFPILDLKWHFHE